MVGKVTDQKSASFGYDAQTDEYGDLIEKGIIDPAKVVRTALQDASFRRWPPGHHGSDGVAEAPKKEDEHSAHAGRRHGRHGHDVVQLPTKSGLSVTDKGAAIGRPFFALFRTRRGSSKPYANRNFPRASACALSSPAHSAQLHATDPGASPIWRISATRRESSRASRSPISARRTAGRDASCSLTVIALQLFQVWLNVRFNTWYNTFYTALQNKDWNTFIYQLGVFSLLAAFFIVSAVYQLYLQQWLQIRWRRWLTNRYLGRWLGDGTHYRMRLKGDQADNPDQRIADDIRQFINSTLDIGISLLGSIVTLVSFVVILWNLSATTPLMIGSQLLQHPGLSRLGRADLRHHRHLGDPSRRPPADQAQFRPAALRGRFPLLAGAAARERRGGDAARRRARPRRSGYSTASRAWSAIGTASCSGPSG